MRAAVKLFSWMNQHVGLEMRRSCEGVITLFGTERFFSGTHNRVALEGRGCWGRVITTCARTIMNQNMFFSSNCQVYRLCSYIGCKWRTSFCHSKASWDGWQSCLFPHSCFSSQGSFKWCWLRSKKTDNMKQPNKEILGKWKIFCGSKELRQ